MKRYVVGRAGQSRLSEPQLNAKDRLPEMEHMKETCRSCLSEERIAIAYVELGE